MKDNMTDIKLMKCGCSGMARHMQEHDGLVSNHPHCLTHSCCEVEENPPNLEGRKARCAYFGKKTYKNECRYGCKDICICEQPSDFNKLAFFEYLPDEEYDRFYCGCHSWD